MVTDPGTDRGGRPPVTTFEPDGHWPGWVDKRIQLVNDYVVKPVTSAVKIGAGYVRDFVPDPPTATEI